MFAQHYIEVLYNHLREFVGLSRTPVILTPARECGWLGAAARDSDNRARPGTAGHAGCRHFGSKLRPLSKLSVLGSEMSDPSRSSARGH